MTLSRQEKEGDDEKTERGLGSPVIHQIFLELQTVEGACVCGRLCVSGRPRGRPCGQAASRHGSSPCSVPAAHLHASPGRGLRGRHEDPAMCRGSTLLPASGPGLRARTLRLQAGGRGQPHPCFFVGPAAWRDCLTWEGKERRGQRSPSHAPSGWHRPAEPPQ